MTASSAGRWAWPEHPARYRTGPWLGRPISDGKEEPLTLVPGPGRDLQRLTHSRFEPWRPRTLRGDHVRRLLDRLVRLRVGHERTCAEVDARSQLLERGSVPEDVDADAHGLRLVEPA